MKNLTFLILLSGLFAVSCSSSSRTIFSKKTPHEAYAAYLDKKDIDKTPEGRAWMAAADHALTAPFSVALPYKQQGFFHPDKPRALGLQFTARQGTRLLFRVNKKAGNELRLFADLYKQEGDRTKHVFAADTTLSEFSIDVDEPGNYILRLQTELKHAGEYSLAVSVGPSLEFPVLGKKASVGSLWGDNRDGGRRRHEGIDIFAPKGTPAVAVADGYIVGVKEGGIGGKTVWLRPTGKNYTAYYAHLDKQSVQEGQLVQKGEEIGLVGNTGNAQTTPAHLHFGIYTAGGATDPLPYVDRNRKALPEVPDKNLSSLLKLTKEQKTAMGEVIQPNTVLVPIAATASGFIAELPDGRLIKAAFNAVKALNQQALDRVTTEVVVAPKS
jgi:murein DD-endopeptidase MepM/ murein hydrolase activator NlpD